MLVFDAVRSMEDEPGLCKYFWPRLELSIKETIPLETEIYGKKGIREVERVGWVENNKHEDEG